MANLVRGHRVPYRQQQTAVSRRQHIDSGMHLPVTYDVTTGALQFASQTVQSKSAVTAPLTDVNHDMRTA